MVVNKGYMYVFCHQGTYDGHIIIVDMRKGEGVDPAESNFVMDITHPVLGHLRSGTGNILLHSGYLYVATYNDYLNVSSSKNKPMPAKV
jgi:hypothetical protein